MKNDTFHKVCTAGMSAAMVEVLSVRAHVLRCAAEAALLTCARVYHTHCGQTRMLDRLKA